LQRIDLKASDLEDHPLNPAQPDQQLVIDGHTNDSADGSLKNAAGDYTRFLGRSFCHALENARHNKMGSENLVKKTECR
jgi:hypothetical protein